MVVGLAVDVLELVAEAVAVVEEVDVAVAVRLAVGVGVEVAGRRSASANSPRSVV
jgi:hypothetical protein